MQGLIVIAGSLAQRPAVGGHTWVFIQYLLGLKRLGWDVLLLDRLESGMCADSHGRPCGFEESENWRYFLNVMRKFGLEESFYLDYNAGEQVLGLPRREVWERVNQAALLINVMGYFDDGEILGAAARRVFLDVDPGFGQMWHDLGQADLFRGHDDFVTIAENIGRPECSIPTCGLQWITWRQPVVLDEWPYVPLPDARSLASGGRIPAGFGANELADEANAASTPAARREKENDGGAFTSIGSWRGPYAPIEYRGKSYGLRAHEFRKFVRLPSLCQGRFEVALDIHSAETKDLALLAGNGWTLADPSVVACDPWVYRQYIQQSRAEFMATKGIYVDTQSGWFSDRSICYLASGRPVLAQDTGLAGLYPLGEGLLTFRTLEEAAAGVEAINSDYASHSRAARQIAEEYFDSDKVLRRLLEKLNV